MIEYNRYLLWLTDIGEKLGLKVLGHATMTLPGSANH